MNRRKKMNATLRKRNKKESAKLAPKNKPAYISKAKRAEMALGNQDAIYPEDPKTGSSETHQDN